MVCMFSQWTEAFPCRQAIASSMAKVFLEKIIPTWGTSLKLHSDLGTHFTGQVLQQVCAVWLVLQQFHYAYHPQSTGLVKHTNHVIKTQLAKCVEALQVSWPKALLLVLLSLRSSPFWTHTLSPFEIVIRCPMHLAPASFNPQLIKGERLQYCKVLVASIKNNYALVEQFFHSALWGDEDLKHHTL